MIISVALKNSRNISYCAFAIGIILTYSVLLIVVHLFELSEPTRTGEPCTGVLNVYFSRWVSIAQEST